ncbi:MAG: TlpA family protein disulfide reductase [Clostridia bacterium]|nr:TlpA family protein disulfide reductase [Clostridia bacterium]
MNKIVSYVCYGLATVVMGSALVYYNFVDKKRPGVEVWDNSPDFTVATMAAENDTFKMTGNTYNLYENEGKVRVVNFWATWCAACKHELPDFDKFAKAYPEVDVIAICGQSGLDKDVIAWMNNPELDAQKNAWSDYSLTFGFYGPDQDVYGDMGGQGMWPTTVVVDEDGVIRYTSGNTLDMKGLEEIVLPLLND